MAKRGIFGRGKQGVVAYSIGTDGSVGLYTWETDEDGGALNIPDRIRFAWHILKTGGVWTGEHVELPPEEAEKLGKFLIEVAEWQMNGIGILQLISKQNQKK